MRIKSPAAISGNDTTYGVTSTDAPGLCSVEWEADGRMTGITCDGFLTTDGTLFVPADGDSGHGVFVNDNGSLDQSGGWYKAETGATAIFLEGQPCVFE